jgi:hypothetical protein
MNEQGEYTDVRGAVLTVGCRVKMTVNERETGAVGTGEVVALPTEGNDWHSFPFVLFDHDGRKRHVPDVRLMLDTTSRVVVTNEYGRFEVDGYEVDVAMTRYLPAGPQTLALGYESATGRAVPYALTVSELLVMLAHADREKNVRKFQEAEHGPQRPDPSA